MRRTALLVGLIGSALVLTGCGSSNDLDGIEVSQGEPPKVTVPKDYVAKTTETKVVAKGDGEEIASGETIKVNYIAINGRTGKEFDNSFKNKTPMTLTLNEKTTLPGFQKGLVGQRLDSRVLVSVPAKDGAAMLQSADSLGLKKEDTMVFLFDLVSKVATSAAGTTEKVPATVPKLTYDDKNQPSKFVTTAKTPAKLTTSAAHVLIKGTGEPVKAGSTVTVQYVGQIYPAGEIFDSSWSRNTPTPVSLAEGASIPCWSKLLPGQTLGSRVILTCSQDDAYGKNPQETQPKGALVFAVDLLDQS